MQRIFMNYMIQFIIIIIMLSSKLSISTIYTYLELDNT